MSALGNILDMNDNLQKNLKDKKYYEVLMNIVSFLLKLAVLGVVGQMLWNNSVLKLMSNAKRAEVSDIIYLAIMFYLIYPN